MRRDADRVFVGSCAICYAVGFPEPIRSCLTREWGHHGSHGVAGTLIQFESRSSHAAVVNLGLAHSTCCAPVACWARPEPSHAATALALPRPTVIATLCPCRKPRPPPPARPESRLATTGPGSPSRWASLGAGDLRGRRHPSLQPSRPLATALFRRRRATSVSWRCTSPVPRHVTSLGRACLPSEVPGAHARPPNLCST